MAYLEIVNRNGIDKVETRSIAKALNIKDHRQWFNYVIVRQSSLIEKQTGQKIEFDEVKNKRGASTKIAWLTEKQMYFVTSLAKNDKDKVEQKSIVGNLLAESRSKKQPVKITSNNWTRLKGQLFIEPPTGEDIELNPLRKFNPADLKGYFSPDEKFATFLENLEDVTGYSLKWDFDMSDSDTPTYTVTAEQAEYLTLYEQISEDTEEDEVLPYMWGDEELPMLRRWCVESDHPMSVVQINTTPQEEQAWQRFVELAIKCVKIYNSPQLREKYGLVSIEDQLNGDFEPLEENSEILDELINAEKRLTNFARNEITLYGFKVHRDWLFWLMSDDAKAKAARLCNLGNEDEVYFSTQKPNIRYVGADLSLPLWSLEIDPRTKVIKYEDWEQYENGYQYHLDEEATVEPTLKKDRPLFEAVRLYALEYEPLFDWYLENIWLPQHSLKFFKSCDPQGYPQLVKVLEDLPQSTSLPKQFVQSVQKQMSAASV